MRQAGEPSVEEILESIKKVIARDNRAIAAVERKVREERGLRPTPDASEPADDDVFELDSSAELAEDEAGGEQPLLPEERASSMRESLAALAMLAEPGVPPQIVRSGETSLEGLTRELLRPALAEWLDKNLPPLVERMVAAEIARIVGKKV
jgi:cell pole-organizing protein PopZ